MKSAGNARTPLNRLFTATGPGRNGCALLAGNFNHPSAPRTVAEAMANNNSGLTEFDERLAELVLGEEAAVLRVGRALERRESDEHEVLRRVDDHVALLAAVAADERRPGVEPVVHLHGVERTAATENERGSMSETRTIKKRRACREVDQRESVARPAFRFGCLSRHSQQAPRSAGDKLTFAINRSESKKRALRAFSPAFSRVSRHLPPSSRLMAFRPKRRQARYTQYKMPALVRGNRINQSAGELGYCVLSHSLPLSVVRSAPSFHFGALSRSTVARTRV